MKKSTIDELILTLSDDLKPTKPQSPARRLAFAAMPVVLLIAAYVAYFGLRPDLAGGGADQFGILSLGLAAILSAACLITASAMASPAVGKNHNGWRSAAAAAAIIPVTALVMISQGDAQALHAASPAWGVICASSIIAFGALAALPLIIVLRAGSPVSPPRAAMMVGFATGAAGALAVALHCPIDAPTHIGIWHAGAILAFALIARLGLTPLFRW